MEILNNRQVFCEEGAAGKLPEILKTQKLKKPFFVVFDQENPICLTIEKSMKEAGLIPAAYSVRSEPDLHVINKGRDLYLEKGCDCVVALGGGSVLDAAKAIGMLTTNGGMVEEYQMNEKEVTEICPLLISIPTTSGTGAEATKVSVVKNNYNKLKKSLYHTNMIADIVILDPELTLSLNSRITAATGMDALSHAIESYVSRNANTFSEMYSLQAVRLIGESLVDCCSEAPDLDARKKMMLGSYFGGCSLTAGIGIAHIMAQPIGAMLNIPHGDACSILLPTSMEVNKESCLSKYADIARALGAASTDKSEKENAEAGIEKVKEIRARIGAPEALSPYLPEKVDMEEVLETIARTTGHITCNPREVSRELLIEAFEMSR